MKNISIYALLVVAFSSFAQAMEQNEQPAQTQEIDCPQETPEVLLAQLKEINEKRLELLEKLSNLKVSIPKPETQPSAPKTRPPTEIEIKERECSFIAAALKCNTLQSPTPQGHKTYLDLYRSFIYERIEVSDESSESNT